MTQIILVNSKLFHLLLCVSLAQQLPLFFIERWFWWIQFQSANLMFPCSGKIFCFNYFNHDNRTLQVVSHVQVRRCKSTEINTPNKLSQIWKNRARIFKLLRSPRIDAKEPVPPGCVLCSLAGQYDNPISSRFLAPIDCLKIPALCLFWMASKLMKDSEKHIYVEKLLLFYNLYHHTSVVPPGK